MGVDVEGVPSRACLASLILCPVVAAPPRRVVCRGLGPVAVLALPSLALLPLRARLAPASRSLEDHGVADRYEL